MLAFPIDEEPELGGRSPDEGGTGPGGGLPSDESDMPTLLGDVVVCPSVAARNATEHGVSLEDEVALLVVHGLLHLLGMDHGEDEEAETMETPRAGAAGALPPGRSVGRASCPRPCSPPGTSGPTDAILVVVVVVLLVGAGLLALAETALVRTSKAKALALRDEHRRGSGRLVRLVEHPQTFLNPILLLVLICQLVTATLVGILAERFFGAWGVLAATFFEVVVIFVLAEALPKNWAVYNPERSALFVAPVISALVGFPPVRMLSRRPDRAGQPAHAAPGREAGGMRESELLAMADVAMEEEVIETQERELIHSIIGFGDTIVREVMVPRPDMRTVEADLPVSQALDVAIAAGFSRLPVHEGNLDDIVGIAFAKDLIRAERDGHGRPARARLRAAGALRPRDQAGVAAHARDAGAQVPPGDRRRRVRRHRRARHPRGPHRGVGG